MRRRALGLLTGAVIWPFMVGCHASNGTSGGDPARTANEHHARAFGDAELPRKIGSVASIGLQIPVICPDGRRMLYLRTDCDHLSAMTLLGSPDPQHTPPEGTLSIWLRPVAGQASGRRLSGRRWSHSPVWSDSGNAVAYVANQPPASVIVHLDLGTGTETMLGVRGAINCLPRFDGDDQTLLFCAGDAADGPFRVYRQKTGGDEPAALTPKGTDCLFPIASDRGGGSLCAQVEGTHLNWVRSGPGGVARLAPQWGMSTRPASLQTWAGIGSPLSPGRDAVLFYDVAQNRICVLHVAKRIVRRHRPRSIAACWLDNQTIALATADGVFIVNTTTGLSTTLFSGQWIPCRYVATSRRLILLGRQTPRRFAIWEVMFKTRMAPA